MISTTSITSRLLISASVVFAALLLVSAVHFNSQANHGQHDTLISEAEELSLSWLKKGIHRRAKARKSGKVHRSGGKDDDYCDMSLFEGPWAYAQGCDGNSYDVVIYRHGRKKYIYKETAVGGECTSEGKFKPKDQLTLDEEGNCVLTLIHLKDSCSDSRSLSVRVVAPKEEESNKGGVHRMLNLYFSQDGGSTFYNEDTPREAIPDVSSDEDSRRILHEQARRLLDGDCIPECSEKCKNDAGIQCCKDNGITNEMCYLNGQGNTCNCPAPENQCYIEMRCDNDERLTWQDGECKIKPGLLCGFFSFELGCIYFGNGCTIGYACQGKANDYRNYYCVASE